MTKKFDIDLIKMFRDDLCKDQRRMEVLSDSGQLSVTGKIMRKFSTSFEEFRDEVDVINFLNNAGISGIPKILSHVNKGNVSYVDMEYYEGIRVFNLLAYLRDIEKECPQYKVRVKNIRDAVLKKCRGRQIEIQAVLCKWATLKDKITIYPHKKIIDLVEMFCRLMHPNVNLTRLRDELDYIIESFSDAATVPFRDSTTKNMLIYCPKLYLGNYINNYVDVHQADNLRKQVLLDSIINGTYLQLLEQPIVDFDFSSCMHLTTAYDDPIGFTSHEITFSSIPVERDLVWLGGVNADSQLIAISYIIRYLRFGGRKLTYHIFHSNAYKYRFKYDNENFYFDNLNRIVLHFWPQAEKVIPEFLKFIDEIKSFDKSTLIDNNNDVFESCYPNSNQKYYIDLFPY